MILSFASCTVPVAPLRREPSHRAEQTSQLLFGEKAEILELNDQDWARIRCGWDDYEGWCKVTQLDFLQRKEYKKPTRSLVSGHYSQLFFEQEAMWLPAGSELTFLKSDKWNQTKFKGKKLRIDDFAATGEALKLAALHYLHAPYQWGGRTLAGIDCSGLSQMAYKLCGQKILRDASQQALTGETVDFLQEARCGDLAFFDNAEGNITHVGLLFDNQTIIHATETTGRVVIDRIDNGGIISISLRKRTHQLRVVKRFLP